MRDDMTSLANPHFSGLRLAPSVPLSLSLIPVRGDWVDNAELLERMAAQCSGAGRSNHIQRGLAADPIPQARQE